MSNKIALVAIAMSASVSAMAADPPCYDQANRYVDCGNGTVTDTTTGLVWLKDAGCMQDLLFAPANAKAGALAEGQCGLTDSSVPGDWRLPTIGEWAQMVNRAKAMDCPAPVLLDETGLKCYAGGSSPFVNVLDDEYWSSSGLPTDPTVALAVSLHNGSRFTAFKTFLDFQSWAVRGIGGSYPY